MYRGIITDISWERVLLTIHGQLQLEPDSHEEIPTLLKERLQGALSEEDPKYLETYQKRLENYRAKIDMVTSTRISDYNSESVYFLLRTNGYLQTYVLPAVLHDDLSFDITINVTNFQNRMEIPNGTFFISALHRGHDYALNCDIAVAAEFPALGRSFLFNKDSECYSVTFSCTTNELNSKFQLKSFLFSRKRNRRFNIKTFFRETRDKFIKFGIQNYYNLLYYLIPKNGKRILFATEARGQLQGNLESIYNRMAERDLLKDFSIMMSFRKVAGGHGSAFSWVKLITYMAISDTILIDDYAPLLNWLTVKPKTKIIQVWHAGVGFKSVGFCRFGAKGSPVLKTGHRKYAYAITGSTSLKHVYSEVFGIEEENVIPTGLPRIDELLDKEKVENFKKSFYEEYPEFLDKKMILFAPTFRGIGQKTAHYPYDRLSFEKIYEVCGNEYVFVFKMHPFIKKIPPIPESYSDRIKDLSSFPNINQLLQVTDILITDYSSVIYEYALLKRPMIFFAYDKKEYSVIRGFHNDFDTFAPGKICTSFDEVINAIKTEDFDVHKVDKFVDENFDYLDGHSSDRFIDRFILNI